MFKRLAITLLALAAVAAGPAPAGTDETVPAREGDRLELGSFSGTVLIETWNRNEVRVQAEHEDDETIEIESAGGAIRVHASSWERWAGTFEIGQLPEIEGDDSEAMEEALDEALEGMEESFEEMEERMGDEEDLDGEVEYVVTVPQWMDVSVSGPEIDVTVVGAGGDVRVESVDGDIRVRGGRGLVSLSAVDGDVHLEGAEGRIRVQAADSDVHVLDSSGDLEIRAIDGDVLLRNIRSHNVRVGNVDGDIHFRGPLSADGFYRFTSHDGDVIVTVAGRPDVEVTMDTYEGDISVDFSVEGAREEVSGDEEEERRHLEFTLGSGGGTLEMESFDGDLTLRPEGPDRED